MTGLIGSFKFLEQWGLGIGDGEGVKKKTLAEHSHVPVKQYEE